MECTLPRWKRELRKGKGFYNFSNEDMLTCKGKGATCWMERGKLYFGKEIMITL